MKIVSDGLDPAVKVVTPKAMVDLIKRNVLPDVIFNDSFDTSAEWTMDGDVTAVVGSITLGSGGGDIETTTAISSAGYYSLGVEFELSMTNLGAGDSVVVEYDADGFGVWIEMMTFNVESAEVDGNTHHITHQLPAVANDGSIKLRFRVLSQPFIRRLAKPPHAAIADVDASDGVQTKTRSLQATTDRMLYCKFAIARTCLIYNYILCAIHSRTIFFILFIY